jgi:hypothetical protein
MSVFTMPALSRRIGNEVRHVAADAWPCRLSKDFPRLLEWDDLQWQRSRENSDARVARERRWPSQVADAL